MQKFIDSMAKVNQRTRSGYHLTLGGLITVLSGVPAELPVRFDTGESPNSFHSYRGYYDDLSLSKTKAVVTCRALLERARAALGAVFVGYKGGDFTMNERTPLWCAEYGSTGLAVVDAKVSGDALVLLTKNVD